MYHDNSRALRTSDDVFPKLPVHKPQKTYIVKNPIMRLCEPDKPVGCPVIAEDKSADPKKQIQISDDFGGNISISRLQFHIFVKAAKAGRLDQVVED